MMTLGRSRGRREKVFADGRMEVIAFRQGCFSSVTTVFCSGAWVVGKQAQRATR